MAGANAVNVIERYEADQCYMDRSTYFSLGAFVCYFLHVVCLIVSIVKPDYTHRIIHRQQLGSGGMAFDDASMPSYLASIGVSIESKNSRNNSKSSSVSSNQQDHSVGSNRSTSQNSLSHYSSSQNSNTAGALYTLAEHSSEDSSSEDEEDHRHNRRGGYR